MDKHEIIKTLIMIICAITCGIIGYMAGLLNTAASYKKILNSVISYKKIKKGAADNSAEWIYNPETDLANCSKCGCKCFSDEMGRIETNYCPNCGRKMIVR